MPPVFSKIPKYCDGIAENLFKKGLCLPSGSNLSAPDLETIVKTINNSLL